MAPKTEYRTPTGPTPPAAHRPRLLIVDDDPLIRKAQARFFGPDVEVRMADSTRAAIVIAELCHFDAVLTDYNMPPDAEGGLFLLEYFRARQPSATRYLMSSEQPSCLGEHIASGLVCRFFSKMDAQAVAGDVSREMYLAPRPLRAPEQRRVTVGSA